MSACDAVDGSSIGTEVPSDLGGTSRHFAATQQLGRFQREADIGPEFMSTLPLSKVVRTKELRQTGRLMAMLQAAIDA